jgi:asparagine synthase (glutamine-hydrolysing)
MCGIAGVLRAGHRTGEAELGNIARRMADALRHRGPDGSGLWVDPEAGVAFGHRRLAIIDLSREGHQPMLSASGRFVIIFNGEIYNFRELRRELEELGHRFRGHSDTEVLLGAIDQWGLGATLPKIAGMFAFALWDRELRSAHLVSDRLGKKPLYFGWIGPNLVFASELKALLEHPNFAFEVDRGALTLLLRHGCVPSPYSICRGILKLPPATHLSLPWADPNAAREADLRQRFRPYWSLAEVAERGIAEPFSLGPEAAVDSLDDLLGQVVAERMISDVPLGALLSGGIDSSTVVASMQKQSTRPIKTFSIGFREAGYDEAADAKRVARHLATDHTELHVTAEQARAVIPDLPEIYDEPFADRSQIPTFLVAKLARQEVTVALSGDGGDEIFGGYNRHFYGPWLWNRLNPWPFSIRRLAADFLTAVPPRAWDRIAGQVYRLVPRSSRQPTPGYRIHKLAGLFTVDGPGALYRRLTSHWTDPSALVIDGSEPSTILTDSARVPEGLDFAETMMYLDAVTYLPDDVLVKVDRASMAVSLEVRSPLLDHRLVEFAWRLPAALKVRPRQGKWVLRQVLDRYVPRELIDRPKQGFDVPLEAWLRGPLHDWAETMLDRRRLSAEGFFQPAPIRTAWREHLSGVRDRTGELWPVLMFQAWLERWCRHDTLTAEIRASRSAELPRHPEAMAGVGAGLASDPACAARP